MLREPSVRVREAAAAELEGRQSDWAYSKPVVVVDVLWNLAVLLVGVAVLCLSTKEDPCVPLRVWIVGYLLQGVVHSLCVVVEFRKRRLRRGSQEGSFNGGREWSFSSESGDGDYDVEQFLQGEGNRYYISFNFNFNFCFVLFLFFFPFLLLGILVEFNFDGISV